MTSCLLINVRNITLFQKDFVSIIQYNILNILLLNIRHSKFALKHLNFYAIETLQLCYDHQRYLIKEIKERKQHQTFKICTKASELLRNETLQLCYDHQRYLIKEIKERKQFLSQRLPNLFDELNQCLTTFLKHKKSYFCKIKLNKLKHLWSSHLYSHTFATKTHSNRSSVLLLSELTPYPNDSVSKKNNIVNLSNKILTTEQTTILNKGLSFCPSKTRIDKIKFCQDNEEFIRKFRLMEYHQYSDKHPTKETPFMKPQSSNWTPPSGRNVHYGQTGESMQSENNATIF